ncbi:HNH endonuclease [Terrimonas sp. NA20]|uniref:HNH endonuclease n=1 Tax=Terrimonas ginsenosidimutans TaxID=2908004 RepID=A0ABS9KRB9_9BACT|nr:HNH endonuclease [Terrimonas ginsenosidimutans]MCG2614872.1 HNH endonuclease [Terrimonas ginsenosidimutans]
MQQAREPEQFKPVPRTGGMYLISSYGYLYSLKSGERKRIKDFDNHGYRRAEISFNAGKRKVLLHVLTAAAFKRNPKKKKVVNHKDGDKSNNYYKNLQWATHSENSLHVYRVLGRVISDSHRAAVSKAAKAMHARKKEQTIQHETGATLVH